MPPAPRRPSGRSYDGKRLSLKVLAVAALATALAAGAQVASAAGGKKATRGPVSSVDKTARSFVVKSKKAGEVTVLTTDKTAFKKADGATGTFDDVVVKSRVAVTGATGADGKIPGDEVSLTPKKAKKPAPAPAAPAAPAAPKQ